MVNIEDNQKQPSAADSIASGIRALIQEELKKPLSPATPEEQPRWPDVFWVLVTIANLVLFVLWLPESLWKNPAFEIVGKILPWVGGGFFLLGTTWFRDRMVEFSRRRLFKRAMAVLLPFFILLHLRFIPLRPTIDPTGSDFLIDGKVQEGSFQDSSNRVWVSLGSHTFVIRPAKGVSVSERIVEWSSFRLIRETFGSHKPRWALYYPITITSDGAGAKLLFEKIDGSLDTDFEDKLLKKVGNSFEFEPKATGETITLPFGKYKVSERKEGCDSLEQIIDLEKDENITFQKMACKTK